MQIIQFLKILVLLFIRNTISMTKSTANAYNSILVVGLNPAYQKRFILSDSTPKLIPGNVHRASDIQEGVGGKGQDVIVSLSCLSSTTSVNHIDQVRGREYCHDNIYLAQFLGSGSEGDVVQSLLHDYICQNKNNNNNDIHSLTIRTESKLRTCTTVIAGDSATELIEPSGNILDTEMSKLLDAVDELAKKHSKSLDKVGALCFMGTMPPGCPNDLYAQIFDKITLSQTSTTDSQLDNEMICLVDSVVGLIPLMDSMTKMENKKNSKNMLKINFAELTKMIGKEVDPSLISTSSLSSDHTIIENLLREFYEKFPLVRESFDYIAITNGSQTSFLVQIATTTTPDTVFLVDIPNFSNIFSNPLSPMTLYPIGAGDTVAAGTLASWHFLKTKQMSASMTSSWMDERVQQSLSSLLIKNVDVAVTAFTFGIACGSASCLKEGNSMFDVEYAIRLFESMKEPRIFNMNIK